MPPANGHDDGNANNFNHYVDGTVDHGKTGDVTVVAAHDRQNGGKHVQHVVDDIADAQSPDCGS